MKEVLLIIQLFFSTEPNMFRAHVPTLSLEECVSMLPKVFEIREWDGRKVVGIGAGCYTDLPTEDPA